MAVSPSYERGKFTLVPRLWFLSKNGMHESVKQQEYMGMVVGPVLVFPKSIQISCVKRRQPGSINPLYKTN